MTSAVETPPSNRGRWGPSQGCLMQPNGGRDCWALTAPLWPRARPLTRLHSSWTFTVRTGVSRSRDSVLWRKPAGRAGWAGSAGEGSLGCLWRGEKWGRSVLGACWRVWALTRGPWLLSAFHGQKERPELILTSESSAPPSPERELSSAGCRRGLRTCCSGSGIEWWERVLDWRQREWKGEWSSKTRSRSGPWGVWWVTPGCRPEHLSRWCAVQGEGIQAEEEEQLWGESREAADFRVGYVECEVTEQRWGVWRELGDTGLEAEERARLEECGGRPQTMCGVETWERKAGHTWTSQHSQGVPRRQWGLVWGTEGVVGAGETRVVRSPAGGGGGLEGMEAWPWCLFRGCKPSGHGSAARCWPPGPGKRGLTWPSDVILPDSI